MSVIPVVERSTLDVVQMKSTKVLFVRIMDVTNSMALKDH